MSEPKHSSLEPQRGYVRIATITKLAIPVIAAVATTTAAGVQTVSDKLISPTTVELQTTKIELRQIHAEIERLGNELQVLTFRIDRLSDR